MTLLRSALVASLLSSAAACGGTDEAPRDPGFPTDDQSPSTADGSLPEEPANQPPVNGSDASTPGGGDRDGGAGADEGGPQPPAPFDGEGDPWLEPAPRATCAEGDAPDGEIQGINGDYRCNVSVVGQAPAPHFLSLAWYGDCAYVNGNDGTTVIRVAENGEATVTTTLTQLGFRSNWESMKANPVSGLLAGYESNGPTLGVYDVSQDCAHPVHQSSTRIGDISLGHAGSFSPDGTIYYASSMFTATIFAVDLTNPKEPRIITSDFERSAHDLFVGKDGTRGYFAYPNLTAGVGIGSFAIMDLTQVQARAAGAKGTLIKEITWEDGSVSQYPVAITYRGKDYLMITDELGSGNCDNPEKPQWGYARIFDISDEQNPTLVSLIKTEAQDPKNCQAAGQAEGTTLGFGLGTHYCNVDRLDDPRLMSCGNWAGGVRVYDIRNPWRPKEVAYFDVAQGGVPGLTRIYAEKRELWVATTGGTFYVLKFRPGSAADQILSE